MGTGTIRDGFGATDIVSNIEGVAGTSKADTFNGAVNISNTFRGFASADTFDGKDTGTTGADTLDYSTDHEFGAKHGIIVNFASSAQVVDLKAFGGTGTLSVATNRIYDSFSGTVAPVFDIVKDVSGTATIEHVNGTAFSDVMFGNAGDNNFSGGGGDDTLNGSDGEDGLFGGDGNDVLNGGDDDDTLFGGNGNDTLTGGQGADVLDGNGDIDTAVYGGSSASIIITLGANGGSIGFSASGGHAVGDKLTNIENLTTGNGIDTLTGNNLANVLSSGSGNDFLYGLAGADTLDGGTGSDMIDYSKDAGAGATHGVIVNLSSSTITIGNLDALDFGYTQGDLDVASNTAYDAFNNDTLIFDTLIAVEYVTGTGFKDVLIGNDANNRLIGGGGSDTLTGGAGGDGFQYNFASDGGDTITDFNPTEDFIRIDQSNFGIAANDGDHPANPDIDRLLENYFVVGTTATEGGHGQFIYDDTTGDLFWDDDGNGGNVQILIATLQGAPTIDRDHFLLLP